MYYTQKGCFPNLLGGLARLLTLALLLLCIFGPYFQWLEMKENFSIEAAQAGIPSSIGISILVLLLFYPFVYIMGGIFPAVQVSSKGIAYRHAVLGGGLIRWNEVSDIVPINKGKNIAVVIKRKGWFLFNGLWLFSLTGIMFTNQIIPILVISSGIDNHDQVISQIKNELLESKIAA